MKKAKMTVKRLLFLTVAAILLASTVVFPVNAASGSTSLEEVNAAKQGVFLVVYCYPDPIDPSSWWNAILGTGFLVNDDTIITCYHVLHPENDTTEEGRAFMEDMIAHDPNYKNKVEIRVYYKAGAYYTATEVANFANSSFDFTAIRLASPIYGSRQLTLCEDIESTLKSPSPLYALGFPYENTHFAHNYIDSYTSRDVDTKDGIMSKFYNYNGGEVISHSAELSSGMSGGPLLNEAGQVVGVNAARLNFSGSYSYSVKISDIIDSLKITGIEYKSSASAVAVNSPNTETTVENDKTTVPATTKEVDFSALTAAITNAESKISESDKYAKEGLDALNDALTKAKSVKDNSNASQAQVDEAASALNRAISGLAEKKLNLPLIIGIAAGAVVVIAVIVIIIIVSSKKKSDINEVPPAPLDYTGGMQPSRGGFVSDPVAPAPSFIPGPNDGGYETGVLNTSNETTVLGVGSNETTVLSSAPYAEITRKSNKEIIKISDVPFVIGKERRKVNYCIDDNSTISRSHAQITKNGSKVCLVDLGSKNGTFVNGVKCSPNASVELKNNDKIVLSDEEFTIKLI